MDSRGKTNTLTVLARLAKRRPSEKILLQCALRGRLSQLDSQAVEVAVTTGGPIGIILRDELRGNPSRHVAYRLQRLIPQNTSSLRELAVEADLQVIEETREDFSEGYLLNSGRRKQAINLLKIGENAKALEILTAAIASQLQVNGKNQDSEDPSGRHLLPQLFDSMGTALGRLGRDNESMEAHRKALVLSREMIEQEEVRPRRLSRYVHNLAVSNHRVRRYNKALALGLEALEIERAESAKDEARNLHFEAAILEGISTAYASLGQLEKALGIDSEIEGIYQELSELDPDSYDTSYATALMNCAVNLGRAGRPIDGLAKNEKAIEIYRALYRAHPKVYRNSLSKVLSNRATTLSGLGQNRTALDFAEEAVSIQRDWVERSAAMEFADEEEMAIALHALGLVYSRLDRKPDAHDCFSEAVSLFRKLVELRPELYRPRLAQCLGALGLTGSGADQQESISSIETAINLYKQSLREDNENNDVAVELALFLVNLAGRFLEVNETGRSMEMLQEASHLASSRLEIDRRMKPILARALKGRGTLLSQLGDKRASLTAYQEAVVLYQELAEADATNPGEVRDSSFARELGRLLSLLAVILDEWGDTENALFYANDAVAISRTLLKGDPLHFPNELLMAFRRRKTLLGKLERLEEVEASARETVEICRLLNESREDSARAYAQSLMELAEYLDDMNRKTEALPLFLDSVSLWQRLYSEDPEGSHSELSKALGFIAVIFQETGEKEKSVAYLKQSVDLRRQHRRNDANGIIEFCVLLDFLSSSLDTVEDTSGALEVAAEEVEILKNFPSHNQEIERRLIKALCNLAQRQERTGDKLAALQTARESFKVCRHFEENHEHLQDSELLEVLYGYSEIAYAAKDYEETLEIDEEILRIERRRQEDDPEATTASLRKALCNLSPTLRRLALHERALHCDLEARNITQNDPTIDPYSSALLGPLRCLAFDYENLKQPYNELTICEERIIILRRLSRTAFEEYGAELFRVLKRCSVLLGDLERYDEALGVDDEAIRLAERLVEHDPSEYLAELATCLKYKGFDLNNLGEFIAAISPLRRASILLRGLSDKDPKRHGRNLAATQKQLALSFARLGRIRAVKVIHRRLLRFLSSYCDVWPEVFRRTLAETHNSFACRFLELDEAEDALESAKIAVDLFRDLSAQSEKSSRDLAASLDTMANVLSSLKKFEAADEYSCAAIREIIKIAQGGKAEEVENTAEELVKSYLNICLSAAKDPDPELIGLVSEYYGSAFQ